jgi:hypothetical protein
MPFRRSARKLAPPKVPRASSQPPPNAPQLPASRNIHQQNIPDNILLEKFSQPLSLYTAHIAKASASKVN